MESRVTEPTAAQPDGMRYECDHCKQLVSVQLEEEERADGGVEQSFNCPACGHRYAVATISAKGVRQRAYLQQIRAEIREAEQRQRSGKPSPPYVVPRRYYKVLARYKREVTVHARD